MSVHDLSFDPRDPLYDAPGLPGVRWGVQVFTTRNLYGLDPERTRIEDGDEGLRLVCERRGQRRDARCRGVEYHLLRAHGRRAPAVARGICAG